MLQEGYKSKLFLEISKIDKVHWFSGGMKKTSRYLSRMVFRKLLHAWKMPGELVKI